MFNSSKKEQSLEEKIEKLEIEISHSKKQVGYSYVRCEPVYSKGGLKEQVADLKKEVERLKSLLCEVIDYVYSEDNKG